MILTPSGHPKAEKMRSCFDDNLIDFEVNGDNQCIEINALFSEVLILFQQFCCSVVGRYQQVQTLLHQSYNFLRASLSIAKTGN